jgi:hypothetical protein
MLAASPEAGATTQPGRWPSATSRARALGHGALWGLVIDSEQLFVGDGGYTEASRGTRRYGIELGAYRTPLDWLIVDTEANDIAYCYESQLPGEAAPVEDIHFHPVEPRTFRLNLGLSF